MTYIARLLRVPGFDSEQLDELRKAFKRVRDGERSKRKLDPAAIEEAAAIALGKAVTPARANPLWEASAEWITAQRRLLVSHILRRTTASKGPDGQPISSLPPITQRRMLCRLRPDEQEVQEKLAEGLVEREVAVSASGVKVSSLRRYERNLRARARSMLVLTARGTVLTVSQAVALAVPPLQRKLRTLAGRAAPRPGQRTGDAQDAHWLRSYAPAAVRQRKRIHAAAASVACASCQLALRTLPIPATATGGGRERAPGAIAGWGLPRARRAHGALARTVADPPHPLGLLPRCAPCVAAQVPW